MFNSFCKEILEALVLKIGVDETSDKKLHKKEDVQPKKRCPSHKFVYVLFSVTQSFLLGFSTGKTRKKHLTAYQYT